MPTAIRSYLSRRNERWNTPFRVVYISGFLSILSPARIFAHINGNFLLFFHHAAPQPCGMTFKEPTPSESHFTPTYSRYSFSSQPEFDGKPSNGIWWSYPEPIFNMYYYSEYVRICLRERENASIEQIPFSVPYLALPICVRTRYDLYQAAECFTQLIRASII